MNIFVLDRNPELAAKMHNDKHVIKMIVESCQILCSVHHMSSSKKDIPYRLTHKNHPCCIWARTSLSNYNWLFNLTRHLLDEYTFRYGKIHKSERVYEWLLENNPSIKDIGLTKFPLAMPEIYRKDDEVESYRNFYINDKLHFTTYKKRKPPYWIKKYL